MIRKRVKHSLTLLILFSIIFPVLSVFSEEWLITERGADFIMRNKVGTNTYSWESAPLWIYNGSQYTPYIFQDNHSSDGFFQIQSGLIGARIYDYYAEFYSPDMEETRLYSEMWEVQRYANKWSDIGAQSGSPTFEISQSETGINITKSFTSWAGQLDIIFWFEEGKPLKHTIYFNSILVDETVYRVKQQWSGIVAEKVKHDKGIEIIDSATILNSSQFRFLKQDGSLSIFENQYSMYYGFNEISGEFYMLENANLQPVEIDISSQGLKCDFIFSNWTLTQGETLTIDPDTSTLDNPALDGLITKTSIGSVYDASLTGSTIRTGPSVGESGRIFRGFVEWDITSIPDNVDITDTIFKFDCKYDRYGRTSGAFGMEIRPSTTFPDNETIFTEIGSGTQYIPYDSGFFPSAGNNKQHDLGTSADSDLEAALIGNWFAIGFRMDNEAYDIYSHMYEFLESEDASDPTPPPSLYVEYTALGEEFIRTVTQSFSWVGIAERECSLFRFPSNSITLSSNVVKTWDANRGFTQEITLNNEQERIWTLSRTSEQILLLSSQFKRIWGLSRTSTQSIESDLTTNKEWSAIRQITQNIGLSAGAERLVDFLRGISQSVSLFSESLRHWTLTRTSTQSIEANLEANRILLAMRQISQNIGLDAGAGRILALSRSVSASFTLVQTTLKTWDLSRHFTQGMSFVSNLFFKLTVHIHEDFIRFVTLSLEIGSDNIRFWDLSRTFSKAFTINSGVWAKAYEDVIRRVATIQLSLNTQLLVLQTIVNEMNIETIGVIGLTLLVQASFMMLIYRDKYPLFQGILGVVAMLCWFALGHISLVLNPATGIGIAYLYDGIGVINVIFAVKASLDFLTQSQDSKFDYRR